MLSLEILDRNIGNNFSRYMSVLVVTVHDSPCVFEAHPPFIVSCMTISLPLVVLSNWHAVILPCAHI